MAQFVVEEAKRCLQCKRPLCKEGCPVNTPFNEVVKLLLNGSIIDAGEMLFKNNPLSVVCSLVCPHEKQCQGHCVLGRKGNPIQVGSVENYVPFSTVYAFNPQTDTWTKKADMPTARFGLQTYLVDGKIYAIGGTNSTNDALATVEVYDPVSDTWAAKPDMPRRFMFFAGAVVSGKIYVIGGTSDMSTGGFEVWEYDPAFHTDIAAGSVSGTWTLANSPCLNTF